MIVKDIAECEDKTDEMTYTELVELHNWLVDENRKRQDRINKAIKYINKCTEKEINCITYKGKEYVVCGSDFNEGAEIILDILQGEDKDE